MEQYISYSVVVLLLSFLLCAFCAASETGIFSLNRYRLKHRAKTSPKAKRIYQLLSHPDKLLGAILIGNVFATAIASNIAHEMAFQHWGTLGARLSPFILTIALLVFAEVTPKTLAALHPEKTASVTAWPLQVMMWILFPVVWVVGNLSTLLLRSLGIKPSTKSSDPLNLEELKTIVNEANALISPYHQDMLLGILDLDKMRVEHVMVPRNEVIGIDLEDSEEIIKTQLSSPQHTLLPIYRSDLDNVLGTLHARHIANLLLDPSFNENRLLSMVEEPYFIPEGTSLYKVLLNFQRDKKRIGLVVDEYGDILGLVTLEDILEEIVGDFTKGTPDNRVILPDSDGSYLIDGSISIRELNKLQNWQLPTEGPNTLSGLIIETLESIPNPRMCVMIKDYAIEIIQMKDNTVKTARMKRHERNKPHRNEELDSH